MLLRRGHRLQHGHLRDHQRTSQGHDLSIEADLSTRTPASPLDEGDQIEVDDGDEDVPPEALFSFADIQRGQPLVLLTIVFALAVVTLGRKGRAPTERLVAVSSMCTHAVDITDIDEVDDELTAWLRDAYDAAG